MKKLTLERIIAAAYRLHYREPGKRAGSTRWAKPRPVESVREAIEWMNAKCQVKRTYRTQFDASFDVPEAIAAAPGIVDISWGNDVSPSFTLPEYERDGDLPLFTLWVGHPEREAREMDQERFLVCSNLEPYQALYNGNDAADALTALRNARALLAALEGGAK